VSENSLKEEARIHLGNRSGYDRQRAELLAHFVRPGKRVAEWGCGDGDTLARLSPAFGLGLDRDEARVAEASG